MTSIINGYNYDIFISYRQKDNKGDGWVSEFVESLKTELESTFKEEISVYFDINPHDGLLETHDVDESLKEKLKCLIFIPVISRTYCDPKAFAWEHEFKAFVEQASQDHFGLKVKLPNGNVASRVLPIVIYDLDKQDIKLFESVIGSVLRGVEFIYAEPGVNRPLRSNEVSPHQNLNHTIYHNQVNKVANTIKDVLNSLAVEEASVDEAMPEPSVVDEKTPAKRPAKKKPREIPTVSLLYKIKDLVTFSQRTWRLTALTFIIVIVGLIWLYMIKTPSPPDRAELRSDIPVEGILVYTGRKSLAISHNGEYLVYVTESGFYLKSLNNEVPGILIPGTTNMRHPVFSADDNWITFELITGNKLMKIPLTGGNPVSICDLGGGLNGMNWYENEIIFAVGSSIYRVPETGGTPELLYPLVRFENDPVVWNPQLLPDKKTLLFSQRSGDGVWRTLTWRLGSKGSPSVLVEQGMDGRYLKSGYLAYSFNNRLFISKFNSRTNRIISDPQNITTNPVYDAVVNGQSQFDFSDNGILVYYEDQETNQNQVNLVWVDEAGAVTPPVTNQTNIYVSEAISSDAKYIAACFLEEGTYKVEIINVKTGNSQLFAEDAWSPSWSADNSSVYYFSTITGNQVFQKPLDLSTPPVMLFEIDSARNIGLYGLSSDGRYLLFDAGFGDGYDIGYYDIINNEVEMLEYYNHPGAGDHLPAVSPDGEWIAYVSDYSGQAAIYVAPFPGPGQPERVTSPRSANDILCPEWAPDMTALFYFTNNPDVELWRINMQFSENDFSYEPAQSFFNGDNNFSIGWNLEIHPDSDRFLIQQREGLGTEETTEPQIKVIVNWEQELDGK